MQMTASMSSNTDVFLAVILSVFPLSHPMNFLLFLVKKGRTALDRFQAVKTSHGSSFNGSFSHSYLPFLLPPPFHLIVHLLLFFLLS